MLSFIVICSTLTLNHLWGCYIWLFDCYIEVSDIICIEGARYYRDITVLFLPLICFEDIFLIEHFIPYLDMFLRTFFIPWFLFVTFICFCRCQLAWCQLRTKVAVVRNWLVCFNLRENFWWITEPTRASLIKKNIVCCTEILIGKTVFFLFGTENEKGHL